ncbi:F-box/kelch-repeat protein At3g23880-like [Arachis stenosperma]|uniref:F-box/kelch-repeat protein At3g23880-like n=1 Tax=Arachis stenosperma TaxID=217475 RepID=UPI0025AB88FB|nr:F-box/kelch-repeat protein At3g23880-like [Arachis stenosperma]
MSPPRDRVVEGCNLVGSTAKDRNPLCPTLPVLPDDILVEILLMLPVRALLQFKCVCKSWRTLISSPQFAMDNFRQRSSADRDLTSRLVYYNRLYHHCRVGFLPLQPLFNSPSATTKVVSFDMGCRVGALVVRGSCNGLVCLHHLQSCCLRLWNPCTGSASQWFRIEFNCFTYYGFGYDHVHDKYKLVTVEGQDLTVICTFGANSSTIGPKFPSPAVGLSGSIGKFVSGTGTLNWMAKLTGSAANERKWVILSFDLANETFGQVPLPRLSGGGDNTCDPELQVLRNCLCFTIDHNNTVFDVWMMKDYGVTESWMMISRVKLWRHKYNNPLTPFSISEHDVLLLMLPDRRLVLHKSDSGLLYFPLIDSSSDAHHFPICSKTNFRIFFLYHDSLVLPPQ